MTDGGRHLDLVGTNLVPVRCRFTVFDHMPFAILRLHTRNVVGAPTTALSQPGSRPITKRSFSRQR